MQERRLEELYRFFDNFTQSETDKFFTYAKKVSFPKDKVLFLQGELCGGILYIESGSIKVYLQSPEGYEITLYQVDAGEQCVINTSSSITSTPALASAVTTSAVKGYILDTNSIKELMRESDSYQDYMFGLFSLKLISLATLIEDLKFKPLKDRILSYIKSKNCENIYTTHEKIAQNLGTSRVVVSRILKELEKEEKLKLHRGFITLYK
ncbi:MAG: Crp/Fnr family transcriptional regulator [Sulfurospirillaceae bacterium]|nr:Crp/Fnr family transcriptional regulator [Sulfurospirillaceae bacterium]